MGPQKLVYGMRASERPKHCHSKRFHDNMRAKKMELELQQNKKSVSLSAFKIASLSTKALTID